MATRANTQRTWRFGVFEVDTRRLELRRSGTAVKMREQSFRILVYLLEHPGEIVTREELRQVLWPSDTFVDFDHSLNTAVMKLRDALCDSTEAPLYIETIPKRGYRFIAPVSEAPETVNGLATATGTSSSSSLDQTMPETEAVSSTFANGEIAEDAPNPLGQIDREAGYQGKNGKQTDARRNRLWRWGLLSSAILLVVGLAVAVYLGRPFPPLRVTEEYTQITHDGRPKDIAGTDGNRLYFNREHDLQPTAQVSISGGEIAQVPVALPLPSIIDVSPDGSTLLVASSDGGHRSLWDVEVPAGSLRRLLTNVWVNSAAWSPDVKSVAYSAGNGDLYVIGSDGTGTRKLADVGGLPDALSWSPDGSKIRFSRDNRLWEMSSGGSGLHPLLPGWRTSSSQCCGRWTPDGRFFVFLSGDAFYNLNKRPSQIWALDERRVPFWQTLTEPVQLTSGPLRWYTPIPSKDGTKIFAQGVIMRGELVRYDAQSSRLQPYLGGISAEFITFSSDGQFVAYVTFPEGILWRANRDASQPVQLTAAPLYPLNPRWSPDGSQILFSSYDAKGHVRAYVTSSQGGTPRPLLPEDSEGQSDPSWSPDGRRIVFSTVVKIGDFNSVSRVLDLASHQITTLPGSEGMWSPRWSPNGRFIAGIHTGPTGGLKVFDFETQRWSVLQLKSETDFPTWSSDSKFIYFLRPWDDPGVYRIRLSDGSAELVVDLKGFRHTGAATFWMGLDPQDTPMLIRDVGTDDIYALTLEQK